MPAVGPRLTSRPPGKLGFTNEIVVSKHNPKEHVPDEDVVGFAFGHVPARYFLFFQRQQNTERTKTLCT